MISKELLSEVLEIKNIDFQKCKMFENYLEIYENNNFIKRENIYELAHKCKEWADRKYNIQIMSCVVNEEGVCDLIDNFDRNIKRLDAKTECLAIIKACQWILDNKED